MELELTVDTLGDRADESLEGGLRKHEVGGFLILLDLSKSDSAWSESKLARGLDTTLGNGCLLPGFLVLANLGSGGNALLAALVLFLTSNLLSWHL